MNNSFELLAALKNAGYDAVIRDGLWWPNSRTFEVIVGAILTQQTKWEKVEISLENLRIENILSLEAFSKINSKELARYIKPSGFYNTKAKNLQLLSQNIVEEFGSFEDFCQNVTREWLLSQKGVGEESADCILCYACGREAMVVDSYTNRLLSHYGYEFETYSELQEWLIVGLDLKSVEKLYKKEISLNEVYARFHGKIVMFCKENMKGKVLKKGVPNL